VFWIFVGGCGLAVGVRVRVLAVLPFVLSLVLFIFTYSVYERLPAWLPIHWNLSLKPDFFIPRPLIVVFLGLDLTAAAWASYSVWRAKSNREISRPYATFAIIYAVSVVIVLLALIL